MCNLIVSTTNNNEPMNRAVLKVARDYFTGKPDEKKEGEAPKSTELEQLEREVAERRGEKK